MARMFSRAPFSRGFSPLQFSSIGQSVLRHKATNISAVEEQVVEVPPPGSVQFNPRSLNCVVLQGCVSKAPVEEELGYSGMRATFMTLAVPRSSKTDEENFTHYNLRCFRFCGQQAAQYIKKGDKIGVEGRLADRRNVTIDVSNFAFLEPDSWPYTNEPETEPETATKRSESSEERTVMKPYLMGSQKNVHQAYMEGKSIEEIAKQCNYKEATVLSYLAACAYHGMDIDFEHLAKSCLLGPIDSKCMHTDVIHAAFKSVMEIDHITDITAVPVNNILALIKQENNGNIYNAQENTIRSVTYSQIATVAAMMKRGVKPEEWNKFKVSSRLSETANSEEPPY